MAIVSQAQFASTLPHHLRVDMLRYRNMHHGAALLLASHHTFDDAERCRRDKAGG